MHDDLSVEDVIDHDARLRLGTDYLEAYNAAFGRDAANP